MEFEIVAAMVGDVPQPHISPGQGRAIYDHVRATRPERVLELGTAHGVSAAYITAALESNAGGHVITVDSSRFRREAPAPEEVLAAAGLSGRVSFERSFSTYTWFLKEQVQQRPTLPAIANRSATSAF